MILIFHSHFQVLEVCHVLYDLLAHLPFVMLQSKLRKCMCFVLGAEVRRQFSVEEEDELLQFAIQQSLIEAGSEKDEVLIIAFWSVQILHVSDASAERQWFLPSGVRIKCPVYSS
jgi:hypothetical protein